LLKYLLVVGAILQNDQYLSVAEHQPQVSQSQENSLIRCLKLINSGGFQPLRRANLFDELDLNAKDGVAMLKSAVHSKKLVRVADDLHYDPGQIEKILECLRIYLDANQNITVIQFKELLNISRKHAIDLLEYFDSQRLTIRVENYRIPAKIFVINS